MDFFSGAKWFYFLLCQGLLLALHLGIFPGPLRGTHGMLRVRPGLALCKENALRAELLLWPHNLEDSGRPC